MDTMNPEMAEALRRDVERCESEFLDQLQRERKAMDEWLLDRALMDQQRILAAQGML